MTLQASRHRRGHLFGVSPFPAFLCALRPKAVGRLILAMIPKCPGGRVLALDRGFGGKNWLAWLHLVDVRYFVRLKKNALLDGHWASHLCECDRWKSLASGLVEVFGPQIRFAAKRIKNGRDPWLAVISHGFSGEKALGIYRQRWGIGSLS